MIFALYQNIGEIKILQCLNYIDLENVKIWTKLNNYKGYRGDIVSFAPVTDGQIFMPIFRLRNYIFPLSYSYILWRD